MPSTFYLFIYLFDGNKSSLVILKIEYEYNPQQKFMGFRNGVQYNAGNQKIV